MEKTHYYNSTAVTVYVGGVMIPPNCSRLVDARFVAPAAPVESEVEPADPILALLDGTVKEVAEALPGLSADDLERLNEAESDGKTRKGVLEAIEAERIRRAAESATQ